MHESNNLRVFKVILDKNKKKFLSSIFGFQKSSNLQLENILGLKSRILMNVCWFLKMKEQINVQISKLVIKSEKKTSFNTKMNILAKNKIQSEKKIVFKNIINMSSEYKMRLSSLLGKSNIKIGFFAGKSLEIPAMVLKAMKILKLQEHDGKRLRETDDISLNDLDYLISK